MPELFLKLGHCYEQQKQFKAALDVYHQARFTYTSSPIYTFATTHEERLLRQYPSLQTPITVTQHLEDAEQLINSGRAADGIAIITPLLDTELAASMKEFS